MKKMFLVLALVFSTNSAFAADRWLWGSNWSTARLGGGITVSSSATESVNLGGPHFIKNLIIQAEGAGSSSTVEVMVNGQVKGTIHAPGQDPSYVVTISETTRSIEFRYRDGGPMRIISVMGTLTGVFGQPNFRLGSGGYRGARDQLVTLANKTLEQVEKLSAFAGLSEQMTYLFPIKRNAGLVYVMATAHGELSRQTTTQLVALSDQIAFAETYLSQLMQLDLAFESVVELLSIKETIKALLN